MIRYGKNSRKDLSVKMLNRIKQESSISLLLEKKFSIFMMDCDGTILYVNKLFSDSSMYTEHELVGKNIALVTTGIQPEQTLINILDELKTKNMVQRRIQRTAKNGDNYWVRSTLIPILDDNRKTKHLISVEIDATNEVIAEKMYAETLNELQNIENALNQSTVVVITDQKGVITYANDKFCRLSKYPIDELIGKTHRIVNSGYHPREFFKNMWRTIGTGNIWTGDIKNLAKDGSEYWVATTIVPFLNEKGKPYQYISIRTDITDRKKAEHALKIALKNDFQQTVKNLQNAVFKYTIDENGDIVFTLLEGKLVDKLNVSNETNLLTQLFSTYTSKELRHYKSLLHSALLGEAVHFEITYLNYTFIIYLSPITNDGGLTEVVGTITDITDRKEAEEQIERMAYYDFITNLPNKYLFEKRIRETIQKSKDRNETFAIMSVDLNRFKYINDSMGRATGDLVLKKVGQRIRSLIRENDIVGRQGDDEFSILLPNLDEKQANKIASQIMEGLTMPFTLKDVDIFVNSNLGISMYPQNGSTYYELTRNAYIAMIQAKDDFINTYQFFTEELYQKMTAKSVLNTELKSAIPNNELMLYYQPQINLKTRTITGVEALIRWEHPVQGMISPARFIPLAEETGLIVAIGQWVLEEACLQAKKWQLDGYPPIQMSINVSPHQFRQYSFVDQVKDALKKNQLDPSLLNLEITESVMSDIHHCKKTLHALREIGVSVSVDDFGTGYSSLSYLSEFPLTHLKIDRTFVQELSKNNRAIVKTIISLASSLDLKVIAEGVETQEQDHFLNTLACDQVQGFLYAKPLPTNQVEPLFTLSF